MTKLTSFFILTKLPHEGKGKSYLCKIYHIFLVNYSARIATDTGHKQLHN